MQTLIHRDPCQNTPKTHTHTQPHPEIDAHMHTGRHFLTSSLKLGLHFSARAVGSEDGKTGEAPEMTEREKRVEKEREAEWGSPSCCQ